MERYRFIREGQFTRDVASAWKNPLAKMFPMKPKDRFPGVVTSARAVGPRKAATPPVFIPKYAGNVIDPPPVSIEGPPAYLAYFHEALEDATRLPPDTASRASVHIGDSPSVRRLDD